MATMAELVLRAKEDCGKVPDREISDTTIQRHISDAIRECSKYAPNRELYSITLVEDQQEYDVESGVTEVLKVFTGSVDTDLSSIFGIDFDSLFSRDLVYDWQMDQWDMIVKFAQKMMRYESFDWDFKPNGKLFIMPPPNSEAAGKKIYYIGAKDWTVATLPERLQRLCVMYGTSQTLIILARWRARIAAPTRSGRSESRAYTDLLRDGRGLVTYWREEMEKESMRWYWG
jgi:hypothetical protein